MSFIGNVLGTPLGYLMKVCYDLISDYGFAIILFTFLTKVILFPVSLLVQKNSIKMIKIKPLLDSLKYQHQDDKDGLLDAQAAIYKKERYNPFAGIVPLLLQIPIIFGLIDVVYRPLKHILHLPSNVINEFINKTLELTKLVDLGSAPELAVVKALSDNQNINEFMSLASSSLSGYDVGAIIEQIKSVNMNFFGLNLAVTPNAFHFDLIFLIPIIAGISALIMCFVQNKINVLQIEQNALSQWGMTLFMVAFSAYFAFLVPVGVGVYWIFGNIFSIPVMYIVNIIYNPKKYIDYATLNKMKIRAKEEAIQNSFQNKLSKKYYKEICSNDNLKKMELMFYSEQSGFYKYYQNIIEALLLKSDITIHYVTSDPNDLIFKMDNPRIKPYFISGNQLIALMMKLECKIVVMTTPDLEKYHIKRSKVNKNTEYVYVDHSCISLNITYRPGALDYFDTIFAVSRDQGIEIREIEALRSTQKKRIVQCGYALIDNMISSYSALEVNHNLKPTLLIAPSWQYDNILDSCLDEMLSSLICEKYKVIVRPHPQYIRRFPLQMENIIEKYRHKFCDDFMIETDFSSNVTVYTADVVITDWSCIAFEFSFTTNKPSLFINTEMKVLNPDYDKIKLKPFDIRARNIIGVSIEKEEASKISLAVDQLISNQSKYEFEINELKNNYFYNLGHSGEVGADYLIESLKKHQAFDIND